LFDTAHSRASPLPHLLFIPFLIFEGFCECSLRH
jgi:hypothetical protein